MEYPILYQGVIADTKVTNNSNILMSFTSSLTTIDTTTVSGRTTQLVREFNYEPEITYEGC